MSAMILWVIFVLDSKSVTALSSAVGYRNGRTDHSNGRSHQVSVRIHEFKSLVFHDLFLTATMNIPPHEWPRVSGRQVWVIDGAPPAPNNNPTTWQNATFIAPSLEWIIDVVTVGILLGVVLHHSQALKSMEALLSRQSMDSAKDMSGLRASATAPKLLCTWCILHENLGLLCFALLGGVFERVAAKYLLEAFGPRVSGSRVLFVEEQVHFLVLVSETQYSRACRVTSKVSLPSRESVWTTLFWPSHALKLAKVRSSMYTGAASAFSMHSRIGTYCVHPSSDAPAVVFHP